MKNTKNPERLALRWWVALLIAGVLYFYTKLYK